MTGPRIKISIASLNGGRGRGGIGSMGSDGRWEIGMPGRGSGVRAHFRFSQLGTASREGGSGSHKLDKITTFFYRRYYLYSLYSCIFE